MSENQKALVLSHICARPRHGDAPKRHFRHYMAQIGGNFLLKSAHGTKFPWDGSADPWDGNRNPWDGLPGRPHRRTKTTLKGGRRWASALTLCHMAHRPALAFVAGLCPAVALPQRWLPGGFVAARGCPPAIGAPPATGGSDGVFHRPPFCSNNMMRFSLF